MGTVVDWRPAQDVPCLLPDDAGFDSSFRATQVDKAV